MSVDPIDDEIMSDQAIHVYRIVQEALNNVLKHSGANEAQVQVRVGEGDIRIIISDNGKGMLLDKVGAASGPHGFGLMGITERAKAMSGTAAIECAGESHVDHTAPFVVGELDDGCDVLSDPGVVDEDVEPASRLDDPIEEPVDVRTVRDIERLTRCIEPFVAKRRGGACRLVLLHVGNDHDRAAFRQRLRNCES